MKPQPNFDEITLALAGILQAVSLMRELTQTGRVPEAEFKTCINSIFEPQADDISTVYGGMENIKLGLQKVLLAFDTTQPVDKWQHRYLLSLIHLQKRLLRSPKVLVQLTESLLKTQKQVAYFSLTHPTVIANLADIYLKTISTFRFRIIILGTQRILHVKENIEKVRALLLAGMRSAVLWKHVGGSRIQLIFFRARIKASAEKLLQHIDSHSTLPEKDYA